MNLDSSVSSIESDVNISLAKAWTAINRLSIIWKSDLFNKTRLLPKCGCINTTVWMHHIDAYKTHREKARWELHKNATSYLEHILEAATHKNQLYGHLPLISKNTQVKRTRHAG